MPIYNGIEFINDSVNSILEQTYENWELIIGINGHIPSSDVYKKAKEYEYVSDKIKVFDFETKGKSNTLNKMLNYCKSNYIALLDVDDIWMSNKLEIQMKYINLDYDVVGSNCIYFGEINNIIPKIPINDISDYDFTLVNPLINSSTIIRKELCFWDDKFNSVEDYDMWLRIKKQNKKFFNCQEILIKHRIHNNSAFNSNGNYLLVKKLLENYYKIIRKLLENY